MVTRREWLGGVDGRGEECMIGGIFGWRGVDDCEKWLVGEE